MHALYVTKRFSKTCVKRPLSKRPNIGFQDQLSSIADCPEGIILQYFRPSLSSHSSLRSLFLFFESPFYTGFTGFKQTIFLYMFGILVKERLSASFAELT